LLGFADYGYRLLGRANNLGYLSLRIVNYRDTSIYPFQQRRYQFANFGEFFTNSLGFF